MNPSLPFKSWKLILALVAIFISGKVVGYAIAVHQQERLQGASVWSAASGSDRWAQEALDRMSAQLGLDSTQQEALAPLINATGEKVWKERERALFQMHLEILALHEELGSQLRPEQQSRLEESRSQLQETISKRFKDILDTDETPLTK